jgi:hypothetical protein
MGKKFTKLVDLPCGCQDVYYEDGSVDREHDHVECDGLPNSLLAEWEASLPPATQEGIA